MKLSVWAKQQGLTYQTAWRLWKAGQLPVLATQLPTGTILVHPPVAAAAGAVALYARVSRNDQRADLERQLGRLAEFATQEHLVVAAAVAEVGSGLNGHRAKLLKLLANPQVAAIVVEHRDRLARFGAEYLEAALLASGRRLIIVEASEMKDDLVQDMIDVLTSFCARLYGRRSARQRVAKAVAVLQTGAASEPC